MRSFLLLSTLAIAGLYACSPATDPPPPPVNEYLVVGNDKGFRNDYIDQANHVTVNDSSIRVRSLQSVERFRDYPIVNGYVEGGADPKLHWRMSKVGQDTITLTDTSRASTFYLHRLSRVDSLPGVLELLASGELKRANVHSNNLGFRNNFVFNNMGQAAGCMIERAYLGHRDWTKMTGVTDQDAHPVIEHYVRRDRNSSLWRLYTRFAQPILVYKNYRQGFTVVSLDSLAMQGDTLFGHSITDNSFKSRPDFRLHRTDTVREGGVDTLFAAFPADPVQVKVLPTDVRNRYRRRWEKSDDPAKHLTVYEQDLKGLSIHFLDGDRLRLTVNDAEIFAAGYRTHPTAPYLLVGDDECDNNAYWHYERHGDSLTFRVPLRVEAPFTEEVRTQVFDSNGKEITFPASRWYATEEWRGTYLLNEVGSK